MNKKLVYQVGNNKKDTNMKMKYVGHITCFTVTYFVRCCSGN